MRHAPIRAVALDMGGTIEDLHYDDSSRLEAARGLLVLLRDLGLDPGLDVPRLQGTVLAGVRSYMAWRERREVELPPERIWVEFVLRGLGLDEAKLAAAAEEIAFYYETHYYTRRMRASAPAALEALRAMGLRLAVISNVMSRTLVPRMLEEYGIAHYFHPVVTSVDLGWRKPSTRIFAEAARLLGLPADRIAYVGDTISRDVVGAQRSGYGLAIQIRSFLTDIADGDADHAEPDAVIADLCEVAEVVAPLAGAPQAGSRRPRAGRDRGP